MNTTLNYIIERFNTLELPEVSEESAWNSAIGATLLLGAGLVYTIYKRCVATHPQNNPHHTLAVKYQTRPNFRLLNIQVSGDRATLPESLKKHLLEQIQRWEGPQGYRFYPSRGIQVLPQNNLTVLTNSVIPTERIHPFSIGFHFDHLSPQDISGIRLAAIDNLQNRFSFEVIATPLSPPEMLDGILQDILNVFNIDPTQ